MKEEIHEPANLEKTFSEKRCDDRRPAGAGRFIIPIATAPGFRADARLDSKSVRFQPEIEPLVRLLEETPRERLLEEVAARIIRGLSYQRIAGGLAAGRRAQHSATARRLQIPCRAGGQFRAPGQPRLA